MTFFNKPLSSYSRGELNEAALIREVGAAAAGAGLDAQTLLAAFDQQARQTPLPDALHGALQRVIVDVLARLPSRTANGSAGGSAHDPAEAASSAGLPARQPGPGTVINGRFELIERLGAGGMGTVFKAIDRRRVEAQDKQPFVAVKLLKPELQRHPDALKALQREAKKAQALAHPNIVRVYDFDRDGETLYMTMEYLSGRSLDSVIRAPGFQGLPVGKVRDLVVRIGAALDFAHRNGIVHCDLKPSNIFVLQDGGVKVIDFGIARATRPGTTGEDTTTFDVAALGALTPSYASAEMAEGGEPAPRDDVYAFGCVTYELLTGRHPFDRLSAWRARAERRMPLRPQTLDRRSWNALRRALALDGAQRTPSVAAFLEGFASPRRWHWWLIAGTAATAAGVFAGALGVQLIGGDGQDSAPAASDPLSTLLADTPCVVMTASSDATSVSLVGYAPGEAELVVLRERVRRLEPEKTVSTRVLGWIAPQHCAPIDVFRPALLANFNEGVSLRLNVPGPVNGAAGTPTVSVSTPDAHAFVAADLFGSDGMVFHLWPPPGDRGGLPAAGPSLDLGQALAEAGRAGVLFGAPLLLAFASPAPLLDAPRPRIEPAAEYLPALAEALRRLGRDRASAVRADFDVLAIMPPA